MRLDCNCYSRWFILPGNYYFLPNTNTKSTQRYSHSLENILNPHGFRIALLRDLNVPGYDWVNRFPQVNSHYYAKNRFDVICKAACYFGLF
jgi:hypothetical protein